MHHAATAWFLPARTRPRAGVEPAVAEKEILYASSGRFESSLRLTRSFEWKEILALAQRRQRRCICRL